MVLMALCQAQVRDSQHVSQTGQGTEGQRDRGEFTPTALTESCPSCSPQHGFFQGPHNQPGHRAHFTDGTNRGPKMGHHAEE